MKSKKWVPEDGDSVYYPDPTDASLFGYFYYCKGDEWDDNVCESGLAFPTKGEAIRKAKLMLEAIR